MNCQPLDDDGTSDVDRLTGAADLNLNMSILSIICFLTCTTNTS